MQHIKRIKSYFKFKISKESSLYYYEILFLKLNYLIMNFNFSETAKKQTLKQTTKFFKK